MSFDALIGKGLLLTSPSSGSGSGGGSPIVTLVTFGLLFLVMYFFLMRPQAKRKKEQQLKLSQMTSGDEIVSIGGIHGVIAHVAQSYVIVKVDDTMKIKFTKEAIANVFPKEKAEKNTSAEEKSSIAQEKQNTE